ncbi:MAG: glycerate kinase [Methylococcales bacterium]
MSTVTSNLRHDALTIFQQGIEAADPYQAVKKCLSITDGSLEIALDLNDSKPKRKGQWSKVYIIAVGKAACQMAKAAQEILSGHIEISKTLAITNYENSIKIPGIEVLAAGHPIPDEAGVSAAKKLTQLLNNTKHGELVLMLISGGGSALLCLPAQNISLQDKQKTTHLLLASGANIKQINCIRKHLSQLKGGRLAKLVVPADLHSLILSDVIGDELSSIASGPTVADSSTFAQAISILTEKNIWDKIPLAVQYLLKQGKQGHIEETPKANAGCFNLTSHTLIGSNTISLNHCLKTAKDLGYKTELLSTSLCGEASKIAEQLALYAKQVENKLTSQVAIVAGGESTVTIMGTGLGGRNQEMALAFAIAAKRYKLKSHWTFLSGGTDGRDGPTDAAGGMVDPTTLDKLIQGKIDPESFLKNNDSYSALKESQDLLITGATGTNVADLQILLIQPK